MKLKIGFIVASTLFLIVVLSTPFAFALTWDACIVNGYGKDLVVDETNGFFSFTAVDPFTPAILNVITAVNHASSDSMEVFLSQNDTVVVSYTGFVATDLVLFPTTEPGVLYQMYYQGPADSVTINQIVIPEFPSILIMPLFMISTLLAAIVYRKKMHFTSQTTDWLNDISFQLFFGRVQFNLFSSFEPQPYQNMENTFVSLHKEYKTCLLLGFFFTT